MEPIEFFVENKTLLIIGHILSVVIGMGSALVTDMLSVRYGLDKKLTTFEVNTVRFLSKVVTLALISIVTFGAMIFLSDPEGYLASSKFLIKMTVVGVLVVNGFLLHYFVFTKIGLKNIMTQPDYKPLRRLGFALGSVSITSWVAALVLGLLPSILQTYPAALLIFLSLLAVAITTAVMLESLLLRSKKG